MARKKKVIEQAPTKTVLNYQGEVKLDIKSNGRVISSRTIKNTGTNILFQQLCLALIGQNFSVPHYLGLGASDANLSPSANQLYSPYTQFRRIGLISPKADANIENNTQVGYNASWTASISYNVLNSQPVKEFGLFATIDGTDMLARITTSKAVQLEPGQVLIITWTMNISNKPAVTTTTSSAQEGD